jgi:hypothetical protein
MGPQALIPIRRKVCCGFLSPLKIHRVGRVLPATLGSSRKHTNHYTTEVTKQRLIILTVTAAFSCFSSNIIWSLPRKRTDVVTAVKKLLLFMTIWREYVSELRILTALLFPLQMIYEYGESKWNNSDRGKPKNLERTLFQRSFSHHKFHMHRPWRKPGPPRWKDLN